MPKTHTTPHHKHHPLLTLLALTLLATQSIITLNNPYGIGPLTHATTLTIAFLTIAIAPFTHAHMPLRIWGFVPLGILFLGSARIIDLQWPRTNGNPHVDILFTLGYLSFGIWFAQLNNQAGKVLTYRAVLDAIAVTTSVILLLWTIPALRTSLDNPLLVLQWTAYPVLDATIVVLTGHIAYRIGTYIHAWYWVCASMTVQLAADLAWAQYGLDAGLTNHTLPSALTATGYGLLAIACAHPSVVTMRDLTMPPQPLSPHPWRHVLLYLPLIPAVIYISLPTTDRIDTTVRVTLTLLLLILLYLRLIGTTNDLSRAENESQHRAQHDSLTGLLNRSALFEVLEQRLNRDNSHHHSTALLFFDCDHFKEVNDTWGHATGDRLLTSISTGLPRQLRADDVIARIGGDEFVIVATVTSPTDAHQLAHRILTYFETPFTLAPRTTHRITPSIGIAITTPPEQCTATELLERADLALYSAKEQGRAQYAVFDDIFRARQKRRKQLSEALRTALHHKQITVHFQPIMAGPSYTQTIGWEALARWTHPTLGDIPPTEFIPLAEELGLIHPIGQHVLRTALHHLTLLRKLPHHSNRTIAINASPLELQRTDYADDVFTELATTGLPHPALTIEVTERLPTHTPLPGSPANVPLQNLARLRRAGINVIIDDFGTGHSSFTSLLRTPANGVKLDPSLISRIGHDPRGATQVRAMIRLVQALKLDTAIAEGVETAEQATVLEEAGCHMAQGNYFAIPQSPTDILTQATPTTAE